MPPKPQPLIPGIRIAQIHKLGFTRKGQPFIVYTTAAGKKACQFLKKARVRAALWFGFILTGIQYPNETIAQLFCRVPVSEEVQAIAIAALIAWQRFSQGEYTLANGLEARMVRDLTTGIAYPLSEGDLTKQRCGCGALICDHRLYKNFTILNEFNKEARSHVAAAACR